MATMTLNYGVVSTLTNTHLESLANSQTAGWQSQVIDNTSTKAMDYEIMVKLPMANTAPSNDKAVYLYCSPAFDDGGTAYYSDGGTATLPSGSEGTYTIAIPNDLTLLEVMNYTTQNMTLQKTVASLAARLGGIVPDKFALVLVNYSGAAISTGTIVKVKWIKFDSA